MQTRTLGQTDVELSEIALGTWALAEHSCGRITPERFDAVIDKACELGVTTFDVAPLWGDGEAERRVGARLAETAIEAQVITRAGVVREDGELRGRFDAKTLIADCEGSLERLGRERVDVWLLHNPGDEALASDEITSAVERLEAAGKIGAWGVSVGDVAEARAAITAGAEVICLTHNLLAKSDLPALMTDLATAGCGVLARSPLMYGMLAGQWSPSRRFASDDHRGRRWGLDAFEARLAMVDDLRFLVGPDHPDLATAALRFVLGHPLVSCALVGARTPYQVSAAVEAASGPPWISDEDTARLAKLP